MLMGMLKNNNNPAPDERILYSWSVETNHRVEEEVDFQAKPFIDILTCKIKIKDEKG